MDLRNAVLGWRGEKCRLKCLYVQRWRGFASVMRQQFGLILHRLGTLHCQCLDNLPVVALLGRGDQRLIDGPFPKIMNRIPLGRAMGPGHQRQRPRLVER